MELNMRNNGKLVTNQHKAMVERAAISDRRVSDEERAWAGVTETDGRRIDPDMFRTTVDVPGGRYEPTVTVDQREASPYRKDGSVRQR
jgi:hypothetical protein